MNPSLRKLRAIWLKRIRNTSGIVYDYVQKELVDSFIKDLEELENQYI